MCIVFVLSNQYQHSFDPSVCLDLVLKRFSGHLCFSFFPKRPRETLDLHEVRASTARFKWIIIVVVIIIVITVIIIRIVATKWPGRTPTHLRCFYVSLQADPAVGFGTE